MAKDNSGDVLVANESFSAEVDGELYVVTKGVTRVEARHPLARNNPEFFEPVSEHVHYRVEDASAEPGKKRGE